METRIFRSLPSLCVLATAVCAAVPAGAELDCKSIPTFSRAFLKHHILYHDFDDEIEKRTIDTYLRRSDPSRAVLLQSEVEEFQKQLAGIFRRVDQRDCSTLDEIHKKVIESQRRVENMVREMVNEEGFELDPSVELVLDPDDRGPPTTREQQKELVRSLVHFQLSNYLSAGTELDEAKERLVHRFELRTRRLTELDDEDLYSTFLDSFAASLDPHSNYLSQEVLEDFRISMSLSLEGIGVALSERDGYAVVERIIPGGAADAHGGLRPKDKIIAVRSNGSERVDIIDMPLRESVSLIRGKKDTPVVLTVLRQGEKTERFDVEIVRDTIDLAEQAAKLRWEERKVGDETLRLAILELPSFYGDSDPAKRQCTDDVAKLLREVNEKGADGLVLDLSRNGGGLLEHAVTISGFFIRRGEIVGIQNSQGQKQVLSDRDEDVLYSGPLVVHTSRVSASASEILAGALKDYRRAVITGDDHTFGKGTVQTVSPLPPGNGALKITTALFFRPGGQSTQNGGVRSDVVIPSVLASDDYGEAKQRFALPSQRIRPFLSSFANANGGPKSWRPVSAEAVLLLAQKSEERVRASQEFAAVAEDIEKARANQGVVRLEELIKEREERKAQEEAERGEAEAATPPGEAGGAGEASADGAGDANASPDAGSEEPQDADAAAEAADEEEQEPSPQLVEAVNVLADLVALERKLGTPEMIAGRAQASE